MKVAELFAGCGGMALGFEKAGLQTTALFEIDKTACATLKKNRPEWIVFNADVKKIDFTKIEADVVAGGFPCQAFSYAGNCAGFEDARGTLFFEFARAVDEIKPKVIIAENVKGLLTHNKGKTLNFILQVLSSIGYSVEYRVLDASFYEVPQKRQRLILIGVRKDLGLKIEFPHTIEKVITVGEALRGVPESEGYSYSENKKRVMKMVPEGGNWRDLPQQIQRDYMGKSYFSGGGKTGFARRLSFSKPSWTLTCSPAQMQTELCHPQETRPLTVREYARLQSFPDSWEFEGSLASQYKQIGNAVPVNLAYHIGKSIIEAMK